MGSLDETIITTQIHHQNIAILYIHITLHLFLFCYGINQLIIIFKLLNLDIPILNVSFKMNLITFVV
jgi:hypothetical protein